MNYFLDTDTCIFALKNTFPAIKERMQALLPERIKIPSIVKAELLLGAQKSGDSKRIGSLVEGFLSPFGVIPFSDECTEIYARIRGDLEKKGQLIGPNDILIAAIVMADHGTLVTHNTKEFGRIHQLKIQDWTHSL